MSPDVSDLSLEKRVVLLGLASLEAEDGTPAHAPRVRRSCSERVAPHSEAVVGTLDEATVARALNELDASGHVDRVTPDTTSAVGKGRPEFALAAPTDAALSALGDDDALADAVDAVRDAT
ncbi:hypothetical protein G9C85_08125 [Halorubellus sp. JP-L1]|uniref:hypothetical protein n=1 Tax=Halorubellus sp. JP-L1 TaxID=2715753 RepID=UPI001408C147|nr:hypothetical protein [Halorubellus sp. JP-L1]NHN41603.1 hypothetical protein [Halorubellus sp. JP-L1]